MQARLSGLKDFRPKPWPERFREIQAAGGRVDPQGEAHFVADPASRRIVVQGDYWYRGEYAVDPDPDAAGG